MTRTIKNDKKEQKKNQNQVENIPSADIRWWEKGWKIGGHGWWEAFRCDSVLVAVAFPFFFLLLELASLRYAKWVSLKKLPTFHFLAQRLISFLPLLAGNVAGSKTASTAIYSYWFHHHHQHYHHHHHHLCHRSGVTPPIPLSYHHHHHHLSENTFSTGAKSYSSCSTLVGCPQCFFSSGYYWLLFYFSLLHFRFFMIFRPEFLRYIQLFLWEKMKKKQERI